MEELEYTDCPACSSGESEIIFISKDFLFSQKEFAIVKCKSCGLLFTNPRIREDRISYYYFADYSPYKEFNQSAIFRKTKNRLSRLFGNIHWEILKLLQSIKAKAVLEIGAGNGNLLYFLKEHGFVVVGIEKDNDCVERIREKGIHCYRDLSDIVAETGGRKFDVVILHHVFEHLYNPLKMLESTHALLNKNGIVYLSIPNSASTEAKYFGKYWCGFDVPRHIIHYDMNSIQRVLSATGF